MGWQKGESGNPNGRPRRGKTLTDILKKHARKRDVEIEGEDKKMSRKEALARALWDMALRGYFPAIKYIYDRIDGKPTLIFKPAEDAGNPIYDMLKQITEQNKDAK